MHLRDWKEFIRNQSEAAECLVQIGAGPNDMTSHIICRLGGHQVCLHLPRSNVYFVTSDADRERPDGVVTI